MHKSSYKPKSHTVIEKYEGRCPECNGKIVFMEASFFCPACGFCQEDFLMEREDVSKLEFHRQEIF